MQTLDDQLLFKRLLEMNIIEKQVKDAFDKLTDNENRDLNEKKELRLQIEEGAIELIQKANDQMAFLVSMLNELQELKSSQLTDEMKLRAFNHIMDEYKRNSLCLNII
jgi:hypothetical protein